MVTDPDVRLSLEAALSTVSLGDIQLSPDGRQVVYACGPATANRSVPPMSSLWLVACDGGPARRLSDSGASDVLPRWSPDGTQIAFLSDRRKRSVSEVYLLDLAHGGEATRLTEGGNVLSLAWSPDGAHIAYAAAPDLDGASDDAVRPARRRCRRAPHHLVARGPRRAGRRRGHATEPKALSRRAPRRRDELPGTPFDLVARRPVSVVATTARSPKLHDEALVDLIVIGLDGSILSLTACETYGAMPRLSPMARRSPSTRARAASQRSTRSTRSTWAAAARRVRSCPAMRRRSSGSSGLPDGRRLLALAQERQEQRLVMVDIETRTTGDAIQPFRLGVVGTLGGFSLSNARDRVAFTRGDGSSYDDVYVADLGHEARKLTDLNPYTAGRDFGEVRELSWTSLDGTEVHGLLRLPVGYIEGERYPLLLLIHGGPAGAWLHRLYAAPASGRWAAVMAQRGYAVLCPNPRGSTGRGTAFLCEIVGCYGGPDWQDLMAGVNAVIDLGIADPEQLVVGGWSGGGFLTNWTITHTDRFRAAVSGAGISNWVSFQGTADCRSTFDRYFGRADEAPDTHWQYSPIREIANAKTPTLILFGEDDKRVPPSQGYELRGA